MGCPWDTLGLSLGTDPPSLLPTPKPLAVPKLIPIPCPGIQQGDLPALPLPSPRALEGLALSEAQPRAAIKQTL